MDTMKSITGWTCLIGGATMIFGYFYYAFWQHLAEDLTFGLRTRFLNTILKQDVSFFETQNVEQLPSEIGETFFAIQEAIGEKFSNIVFSAACLISGIGVSFYIGPDFAAICIAYFPIILIFISIFGKAVRNASIRKMGVAKKLGGVVEESFSAIKLIVSFA